MMFTLFANCSVLDDGYHTILLAFMSDIYSHMKMGVLCINIHYSYCNVIIGCRKRFR